MIQHTCISSSYRSYESSTKLSPHANAFRSLSIRKVIPTGVEKVRARVYGGILRVSHTDPRQEKYAIVQGRYSGKWSFPKGHSNEGELPLECTLREIQEETGIKSLSDPVETIRFGYGNYHIFSLNEPLPLIPQDTYEIMNAMWATIDEMELLSLNVDVSRFVKTWKKKHD
jgi:hypothetical protein